MKLKLGVKRIECEKKSELNIDGYWGVWEFY